MLQKKNIYVCTDINIHYMTKQILQKKVMQRRAYPASLNEPQPTIQSVMSTKQLWWMRSNTEIEKRTMNL